MLEVLVPLSIAGLFAWWRMLRGLPAKDASAMRSARFGILDAIVAATLVFLFMLLILAGTEERGEMTVEAIMIGCVFWLLLILCVCGYLLLRKLNPTELFGLEPPHAGKVALRGLACLAASYPIVFLAGAVAKTWWFPDQVADRTIDFLQNEPPFNAKVAVVAMAVGIAPVAEEFIFRGFLYGVVRRYGGRLSAILTTSLLFAAIHLSAPAFAPLFFLAVALALAYELTGSLWAPILMHMVFNALSLVVVLFFPQWIPSV